MLADGKSALPTFRRVLLLAYNPTIQLISLRHYTITVRSHGVTRRVRKLLDQDRKPDISRADDLADYLLKRSGSAPSTQGYDTPSESEVSEAESETNAVELPDDYGRGHKKGERKAVRLIETGPRLELKLVKVVEGLVGSRKGEGQTVFHEFGGLVPCFQGLDRELNRQSTRPKGRAPNCNKFMRRDGSSEMHVEPSKPRTSPARRRRAMRPAQKKRRTRTSM